MNEDPRIAARRAAAAKMQQNGNLQRMLTTVAEGLFNEDPYRAALGMPATSHAGADNALRHADMLEQQAAQMQAQADADQADAEKQAVESDPNNPRAQALQRIAAENGMNVAGLGAKDIMGTGLIGAGATAKRVANSQAAQDARLGQNLDFKDKQIETSRTMKEKALVEAQRHNQETEGLGKSRLELARARAAAKKGNGTSKGSQANLSEYAPDKIEARRDELLKSGFSSAEVDELKRQGPRFAQKTLGKFVKPDEKAAAAQAQQSAPIVGASGELVLDKGQRNLVNDLHKQREKEQVRDQFVAVDQLRQAAKGIDPNALKLYFATKGKADGITKIAATFGNDTAQKLAEFDQAAAAVGENFGRKRSGAAIGKSEWDNFYKQLGLGQFSNPQLMNHALSNIENRLKDYDQKLAGRGKEGAVAMHEIASSPGYQPAHVKSLAAQVGKNHGLYVTFTTADGKSVLLPAAQAKKFEAAGKGKIQ